VSINAIFTRLEKGSSSFGMRAGAIGGLVTGGLTLLGVIITQKRSAEREKENRKEEERRILVEKRTQAYANYIWSTVYISSLCSMGQVPREKDFRDWYKFTADVKLLGSPKFILAVWAPLSTEDWKDASKMISYCNNLVRLAAEELQGVDVYKEIFTQISEQKANS